MSVENIAKKIIDEAQSSVRSIDEKAERDISRTASELDRQLKELKDRARRQTEAEAQEVIKRRISSARLEGRKRILGEKEMILGEIYAEARERILALPEDKYLGFLKTLAAAHSVGGKETVMLSQKDLARLKGKLPQWEKEMAQEVQKKWKDSSITVSTETRDIEAGLVLSQGRTEINLSLDVILAEAKYILEGEVTGVLSWKSRKE
jgi:V/A-type H+/Na+-transporting ATPase subunit E